MESAQRDSTDEWLLPEARRPLTIAELEQRVDHALAVARSAETAALEIGAAAIDSAEQAKRAAGLALRASELAASAPRLAPVPAEDHLTRFSRRADRLCERLARIERR